MFLPADASGPKEAALAALMEDSPQKRLLAQKATPPPSPLLSELLKKGNLISAGPRLVRDGRVLENVWQGPLWKVLCPAVFDCYFLFASGCRRRCCRKSY